MAIIWVAEGAAGTASSLSGAAVGEICAALAAASWVIGAGVAYWFGSDAPKPGVDVSLEFDPDPSWACVWHPDSDCFGQEMGCTASTT